MPPLRSKRLAVDRRKLRAHSHRIPQLSRGDLVGAEFDIEFHNKRVRDMVVEDENINRVKVEAVDAFVYAATRFLRELCADVVLHMQEHSQNNVTSKLLKEIIMLNDDKYDFLNILFRDEDEPFDFGVALPGGVGDVIHAHDEAVFDVAGSVPLEGPGASSIGDVPDIFDSDAD